MTPILQWLTKRFKGNEGGQKLSEWAYQCIVSRMPKLGQDSGDRNDMLSKVIPAKHADGTQFSLYVFA